MDIKRATTTNQAIVISIFHELLRWIIAYLGRYGVELLQTSVASPLTEASSDSYSARIVHRICQRSWDEIMSLLHKVRARLRSWRRRMDAITHYRQNTTHHIPECNRRKTRRRENRSCWLKTFRYDDAAVEIGKRCAYIQTTLRRNSSLLTLQR